MPILDQFGHPVVTKKPGGGGSAAIIRTTRQYRSVISDTLDAQTVISYLRQAELGSTRYQFEMFERMIERDPHLSAVLQTRRLAVQQLPRWVAPADESNPAAVEAADLVQAQLDDLESFDDDLGALLDAVPMGIAVEEIVWRSDWTLERLVEVEHRYLDWTGEQLDLLLDGWRRTPMPPNKFIRHLPRLRGGSPLRRGLMRSLAILWCISHFAMEDWAGYAEVFGMPLRIGRYDATARAEDIALLVTALKDLGSDASAVIPKTLDIDFAEPTSLKSGNTGTPMEQLIKHCERKMTICVLGHDLMAESQSGSGTLAGNAAEKLRLSIRNADCGQVGATIRRDLFRPMVGFILGFDVPVPFLRFDTAEPANEESRAKVFQMAIDMGQEVSRAQVRSELSLDEPTDEEDTIRREAPASAAFSSLQSRAHVHAAHESGDGRGLPRGSALRANEIMGRLASEEQGETVDRIFDLVGRVAERVEQQGGGLEQMLTQIKLAAPDSDTWLAALGLTMDQFTDMLARTMTTGDLNGRLAARAEREV